MKKFTLALLMLFSVFQAGAALALTLDEAKSLGLVGEKVDGYIAAVPATVDAEVRELIAMTNDGRRKVYEDLAKRNGITVEAVGILSAEKLRASAGRGEYVQAPSGQWERK